ncbi:hypothetical protein [Burkholderia plantarii]|uniref:hypothetical protein n=1 Tax=Burkholderia plantarii TaxID=41899 RepID=UPI0011E01506|nr:hypothetical protein [Burkholderia plantarii]
MAGFPDETKAGIKRKSGDEMHDRRPCCSRMVGKRGALSGACRLDDTDLGQRPRDGREASVPLAFSLRDRGGAAAAPPQADIEPTLC